MKILTNEIKDNHTLIVVGVDKDLWKQQQQKAFNALAKNLSIQGFRKGHVPPEVAKSKINEYAIIEKAINPTIDAIYKELIKDKTFDQSSVIIDALKVDVKKVDKADLEVVFQFENYPKVTTPDIKSIKISYEAPKVEEAEIQHELSSMSKRDWMLSSKESGIVEKGDIANIDFEGFLDDKPFPNGSAKAYDLEIGSGSFIPGFEDQLVGLKKGDKKDINVSFPENYHEKSLAGKPVKFAIVVNDVKQVTKPTLDDSFAASLNIPNVKTLSELKSYLSNQILEMKKLRERDEAVNEISKQLIEKTTISYFPECFLKDERKRVLDDINKRAKDNNTSFQAYMKNVLGFAKEEDFDKNLDETVHKNLTLVLAIESLINQLGIKVEEQDLNDYFAKVAQYYGGKPEDIKKMFDNRLQSLKPYLAQQKLFDKIIELISK